MAAAPTYDVAIVGYGPTGVTAANLLGALGLRVVVIERDPEVFARARAISTDEEVLRIWQRIGLAEQLKRDMLIDRPIDFVDDDGRSFFSARLPARDNGHPPQAFLYQPSLEQVLREGVEQYPNVEVLLDRECLRVSQDESAAELAVARIGGDELSRLRATYVIAADGGSSPIRSQLNVGFEGRTYETHWVVIDTEMIEEWDGHDRLRFHCDPARPAVDCPTPLGHHRWEFPILPGESEEYLVSDAGVWQLLARYGLGAEHVKILRATVYSHHIRFAARWRVGRVFLAGDAAHAMPPWIGQGMGAGVRDVANLCWKLAAVVRGELPEDVLESYEAERKPHVRGIADRAVFAGRLITERRRPIAQARNLVFRTLCRSSRIHRMLESAIWVPAPHYDAGLFGSPVGRAVGCMIPQPVLTDATGTAARLDDLLGTRWVVLHARAARPQPSWDRAGVASVVIAPRGAAPAAGRLVDTDGTLLRWMAQRDAATLAVRPDGFVFAAAPAGARLAEPPSGLSIAAISPTTTAVSP